MAVYTRCVVEMGEVTGVITPFYKGNDYGPERAHSYWEKASVHLTCACHLYSALSFDTIVQTWGRYLWYFLVH